MRVRIGMHRLVPCSGSQQIPPAKERPRGHVYKVLKAYDIDPSGNPKTRFCGWVPLERAITRYERKNIIVSGSDGLCPICYKEGIELDDAFLF